ncbi:MAG: GNAT family N-acetyltransferase [Burkholderiales bacterium]|uniref:GNAT family N-acetyltransferase n=1 Tax=Nitrosomonas sp. TaxID=42353 RepID=UPI001DDD7E4F|nr:GNAT family N-acetyltransferase [Nitrosomonas sp.]MCB1947740.1 GNAT family N-acetyltransferase [Nitrosomonas sp.]MCP5244049.1 GNAT family N-acetyltransferase [Burkholderiales bacterium]
MSLNNYQIHIVQWHDAASLLRAVRETVFIYEQQVPEELEWDTFDAVSVHALATGPVGEPIGTARLLPDGRIGRMAVLKPWRNNGIGSAMLHRLIDEAKNCGLIEITLNAQVSALAFYTKYGFQSSGETFMEADIPHVKMHRKL